MIAFEVPGVPAPQGSKVRTRWGMREASKRVEPWRYAVKVAAIRAGDEAALLGPLRPPYRVDVWFFFQRPRTTRATHPVAPTIGDLDMLLRSTYDALVKGGLLEDDRHVVTGFQKKAWAGPGETPGAVIRVTEIP